jgi:hypothetical protein
MPLLADLAVLGWVSTHMPVLASFTVASAVLAQIKEPCATIAGLTALHYAASGGHDECVEALLAAGADVSAQDSSGRTPLHLAALSALPMCAFQLAGHPPSGPSACLSPDGQQQTPINLALASEKGEVSLLPITLTPCH